MYECASSSGCSFEDPLWIFHFKIKWIKPYNLWSKLTWKHDFVWSNSPKCCESERLGSILGCKHRWVQTPVCQSGVCLAGWTVCSQQTDCLDESLHEWAHGGLALVFGCECSIISRLWCFSNVCLWTNLKITLYGPACICNPRQTAEFACSSFTSGGHDGTVFKSSKEIISAGLEGRGFLICFTQSLTILSLSLSTGWSQANPGWTSPKVWNRPQQGEHASFACCLSVRCYQSDSYSLELLCRQLHRGR